MIRSLHALLDPAGRRLLRAQIACIAIYSVLQGVAFVLLVPILVLDEATAFADPESEAAIQDALSRLAAGRTLVVIAHRLSTVAGADQILVLSGGRVVERGRHGELLAADGEYARLWTAHERAA